MGQEDLIAYIEQSRKEAERVASSVKDFRVFSFDHIPERPVIRPEVKRIVDCLVRYQNSGIPRHMAVFGARGCGKTLTFRYLERAFADKVRLPFFGINCRVHNSSFKALAALLKTKPRGYAYSELCERFEREIPSPAVIVLDESDMLGEKDSRRDILYFLSRSPKRYLVVLLSNNHRYLKNLDESTRSSLQPEVIPFRTYSAQEILDILKDRAETGLKVVEPGLIEEIAAMTAKNTNSDVRVGIKALLYAATNEAGTVEECFSKAREDIIKDVLADTNEKALLILKAAQEEPTRLVKTVYQHYVDLSRNYKEEPYGYTQFYSTLGYLASLGLILMVSAKVDRTFTNRIEPLVSPDELNAVFAQRFQ
ncbi:MAG: orc1/cdc6 family replication initiation protein [Kiritimatiellae bacterium]|nr:orc1/cdc6 family replication initiation protein [Kiritimatiellia bacterium]